MSRKIFRIEKELSVINSDIMKLDDWIKRYHSLYKLVRLLNYTSGCDIRIDHFFDTIVLKSRENIETVSYKAVITVRQELSEQAREIEKVLYKERIIQNIRCKQIEWWKNHPFTVVFLAISFLAFVALIVYHTAIVPARIDRFYTEREKYKNNLVEYLPRYLDGFSVYIRKVKCIPDFLEDIHHYTSHYDGKEYSYYTWDDNIDISVDLDDAFDDLSHEKRHEILELLIIKINCSITDINEEYTPFYAKKKGNIKLSSDFDGYNKEIRKVRFCTSKKIYGEKYYSSLSGKIYYNSIAEYFNDYKNYFHDGIVEDLDEGLYFSFRLKDSAYSSDEEIAQDIVDFFSLDIGQKCSICEHETKKSNSDIYEYYYFKIGNSMISNRIDYDCNYSDRRYYWSVYIKKKNK